MVNTKLKIWFVCLMIFFYKFVMLFLLFFGHYEGLDIVTSFTFFTKESWNLRDLGAWVIWVIRGMCEFWSGWSWFLIPNQSVSECRSWVQEMLLHLKPKTWAARPTLIGQLHTTSIFVLHHRVKLEDIWF